MSLHACEEHKSRERVRVYFLELTKVLSSFICIVVRAVDKTTKYLSGIKKKNMDQMYKLSLSAISILSLAKKSSASEPSKDGVQEFEFTCIMKSHP